MGSYPDSATPAFDLIHVNLRSSHSLSFCGTIGDELNGLLNRAMATTKIRKTPEVCNGAACIGRTQIPVWELIALQLQGCSDANLLNDYPQLTRDDLKAARTYYAQHPEEIDAAINAEPSQS